MYRYLVVHDFSWQPYFPVKLPAICIQATRPLQRPRLSHDHDIMRLLYDFYKTYLRHLYDFKVVRKENLEFYNTTITSPISFHFIRLHYYSF